MHAFLIISIVYSDYSYKLYMHGMLKFCYMVHLLSQHLELLYYVKRLTFILYVCIFSRLSKMHAKTPICFNFFNFHLVSSKFSMNIEHIILTKRMFFVFGIATFWRENDVTNLAQKN